MDLVWQHLEQFLLVVADFGPWQAVALYRRLDLAVALYRRLDLAVELYRLVAPVEPYYYGMDLSRAVADS